MIDNKLKYVLVLLLTVFSAAVWGQTVTVNSKPDTNAIMTGDQIRWHIEVTQPRNKVVGWPFQADTITSHIEIVSINPPDTAILNDSTICVSTTLALTSFDSGAWVVPPLPFVYDIVNDTTYSYATSSPFALKVDVPKVDLSKPPKAIKPIVHEPFSIRWLLNIIMPVLFVILVIIFAIYYYRRKKADKPLFGPGPKPLPPPEVEAREALAKLKDEKLWQQGHVKEYYTRLIDIVRRYLERRFEFPAPELVTDEIIGCMKSYITDDGLIKESQNIMEQADLVKFAKAEPLPDVHDSAMKWALKLVEETTKAQQTNEKEEDEL